MSTIDEIMGAIGRHGDDCIRDADAASESFEGLREMIATALEEARREVAEAMRDACEKAVWLTRIESELPDSDDKGVSGWLEFAEDRVRRSPIPIPIHLPTGERQAVLLTDEQILAVRKATKPLPQPWGETLALSRAIEAASLAANNLEARRG